jgi:predicted TIM-barrel fold metal-dependent hydrolase
LQPVWTLDEAKAFAEGAYIPLLEIAQDVGLPVCLFIPGYVELLEPYVQRFPELTFVIDHCGMGFPGIPPDRPEPEARSAQAVGYFDQVLRLAEFPNVALKWSHAQDRFGVPRYPYDELRPLLRSAIEAFGADRLLWASDKSVMFGHTWTDLLHCVRDDSELSQEEREWILGRSARRILQWPSAGE